VVAALVGAPSGRLLVKCVQGHNIRKKGQAAGRTRIDAFLSFQLGKHKKSPKAKTAVHKKSNEQPNFQNEVVKFDVLDVGQFYDKDAQDGKDTREEKGEDFIYW
jgi:hypothetical protein